METDFDIELPLLLQAVHAKYGYDFRHYATASLKRRMKLAQQELSCRSLSVMQERVLREPDLMHRLLGYLTVQVSEMFRDPEFFLALREKVVPFLRTWPSLKVWIPGCAGGEEVYSMAILLREEGLLDRTLIYATDINREALRKAEAGLFPLGRMAQFSKAYHQAGGRASLADYYTVGYGSALFDRSLREKVLFSDHSLTTDSAFAEVELITCRNVLIYFDHQLQDRAIGLFSSSLCHGGFLGLGSKETLSYSKYSPDFADFVADRRIYRRQ